MKNSYRHNKRSPVMIAGTLAVTCSVILFGFDTLTGGLVRSYARTVGSIVWVSVARVSEEIGTSGVFASRRSLAEENSVLKERLALFEEQSARYRALEIQNEALREMVSLAESDGDGITARVLSSFTSSPYGTFVIAAGTGDGVTYGDIVLTPGGFALGRVSDLDTHTATVDALFSPGSSVEVIAKDVAFSVEGRGGGNARAEIPRGAGVMVGDAVIAPAFGGRVAGVIGSIESASSSATQLVFIRLPHTLDALRFVYVIPAQ